MLSLGGCVKSWSFCYVLRGVHGADTPSGLCDRRRALTVGRSTQMGQMARKQSRRLGGVLKRPGVAKAQDLICREGRGEKSSSIRQLQQERRSIDKVRFCFPR